jgi:hypothetical protein
MSTHFSHQYALFMLIHKNNITTLTSKQKKSKLLTSTVFGVVMPYCPTFRRNVLPPSSGPKSKSSKQTSKQEGSAYSSILNMAAVRSSEMTANSHETPCRYIPKDTTLRRHGRVLENISSWCFEKKNHGQQFLKPIITTSISRLYSSPSLIMNLICTCYFCL